MKRIILIEEGDVIYNPEYNGFHQIRKIKKNTIVLSGCCNFISDTKTTICNKEVATDYLKELKPIYKKKHKFMEWNKGIGAWEATSKKEKKAYLFYEDDCIIKSWNN